MMAPTREGNVDHTSKTAIVCPLFLLLLVDSLAAVDPVK
jgi:hypothetical protein